MIYLIDLRPECIGRWVEYKTSHSSEQGRIKTWNDEWVFVVYHCDNDWDNFQDYTGAATNPKDLNFIEMDQE